MSTTTAWWLQPKKPQLPFALTAPTSRIFSRMVPKTGPRGAHCRPCLKCWLPILLMKLARIVAQVPSAGGSRPSNMRINTLAMNRRRLRNVSGRRYAAYAEPSDQPGSQGSVDGWPGKGYGEGHSEIAWSVSGTEPFCCWDLPVPLVLCSRPVALNVAT